MLVRPHILMPVPAALSEANQPQARSAHVLHDAFDVAAGENRDAVAPAMPDVP
jgi:hypothetical protein